VNHSSIAGEGEIAQEILEETQIKAYEGSKTGNLSANAEASLEETSHVTTESNQIYQDCAKDGQAQEVLLTEISSQQE